jgi:hypothetical protein
MACPAATVFRNYFWKGNGQAGGSAKQINTAKGVAKVVGNATNKYWTMKNGYLTPTSPAQMANLATKLKSDTEL